MGGRKRGSQREGRVHKQEFGSPDLLLQYVRERRMWEERERPMDRILVAST